MIVNKSQTGWRDVLIVLLTAWLARFLFVWFMPPQVLSNDILAWETVARYLAAGSNPYQATGSLNWPPLWMQMIYLISKASTALDIPFRNMLRIFLTGFDSLVILALFRLMRQIAPQTRAFVPILLGIALNPTTIFLTCQHGNFDVIVALCVVLFVGSLVQYYQGRNEVDWVAACLFLGLGILAKTVPIVLCPMLAGGWRRAGWRTRLIGAALLFGPVTLGMSVIYVLAPGDVVTKVLGYRSGSGYFGVSGLLLMAGGESLIPLSQWLFYLALAGAGVGVASVFWRRERLEGRDVILCAAMFLAAIPGIGPGYASQYLYWFLPLLIATWAVAGSRLRRVILAFGIVAAFTCIVEYGFFPSHGAYVLRILMNAQSPALLPLAVRLNWWLAPAGQTLIRLPLFMAYVVLLVGGVRQLIRDFQTGTPEDEIATKVEAET